MYWSRIGVSVLAMGTLLGPAQVWAQGSEPRREAPDEVPAAVEAVVVTGRVSEFGALKSPVPILETARSVSVETQEAIRDKGALTLADALTYSAGVIGDQFGFSTRGDFATIRGFSAAEYRDGQQVLFGFYNNTRSDIYMLDQVEILKGPASVLYGKGTPGGVVNAVSKVARRGSPSELVVDIGSFSRKQISSDLGFDLTDSLSMRLVALYRDSGTQLKFVNDDALIAMPSITWDNGTTRLTALVEFADRKSDTDHQFLPLEGTACASSQITVSPSGVCVNATGQEIPRSTYLGQPGFNRYDTKSTFASLFGTHAFTDRFAIDGIIRYKDGSADYRQAWLNFPGAGRPRTDAAGNAPRTFYWSDAASEQFAVDLRARLSMTTGPLGHDLLFGGSFQDVTTSNASISAASQGTLNIYNPTYGPTPPQFLDASNLFDPGPTIAEDRGLYISDQISWGGLRVNLGLRYDKTESRTPAMTQEDDATSFSAGLLYAFDNGLSPYASFAESFQPVIGRDGLTLNPLKPREGRQWEIGVKYQPRGTRTFVTAAYFDIEESNLPNPANIVGQPGSQQEGVGKVKGFEIEAQSRVGDWSLEGNVSHVDSRAADGFRFASVPAWQSSAWVKYAPSEGPLANARFGAGLRYSGERESNALVSGDRIRIVTGSNVVADLMAGYAWGKWDAALNVRNLTNSDAYATCLARGDCFPIGARTVSLRLGYRW